MDMHTGFRSLIDQKYTIGMAEVREIKKAEKTKPSKKKLKINTKKNEKKKKNENQRTNKQT